VESVLIDDEELQALVRAVLQSQDSTPEVFALALRYDQADQVDCRRLSLP